MKNIVSVKGDTITIKFDKLFNRDVANYNEFKIDKRSYHKKLQELTEDIKLFIEEEECEDYAYNLLYYKFISFKDPDKLTIESARKFVNDKIFADKYLIDKINNQVESIYSLSVDTTENKNENLQITNDMNKKYLKSAIMMRLLLPIISTIGACVENIDEIDKYVFELYTDVMLFFNNGDKEILEKIYNIVSSRITSTRYSDKEIWELLKKQNKDIQLVVRSFYSYIIINNFVKIINNTSIISYIDVILRNKLNFAFRLDYKVSHRTLDYNNLSNNSNNDNNNLTEIDKLESVLLRKDKGIAFINKASINMKVNQLKKKFDGDEIFECFKENYKINEFTKIFIEIYYRKEFEMVYEKETLSYLLYNMVIDLLDKKVFHLIPKIVYAEEKATKMNNKKKIIGKLSDSVKYKLLLEKYDNIRNIINNNNFVYDIIIKLKSKQFIDPISGDEIEIDLDKINEEILDFLFL